jgi:hypothetical protein
MVLTSCYCHRITHLSFPHRNLVLNNVLVSPHIIKNSISIRRFTTDNNCSIEFDPFGLSVKDLQTRNVIARCNSSGNLYPFFSPATSTSAFLAAPTSLWHRRLGHLGRDAFSKLIISSAISCDKDDHHSLCHACQLGRHTRLLFHSSHSRAANKFDLIHCDLWTSPLVSASGYKYYLVILDDYSHYIWSFPLRLKSDTFSTLSNFFCICSHAVRRHHQERSVRQRLGVRQLSGPHVLSYSWCCLSHVLSIYLPTKWQGRTLAGDLLLVIRHRA